MMLTNTFFTALLTATLLPVSIYAMPSSLITDILDLRSLDVTVKWHSTTNCNGKGGPARQYSSPDCITLTSDTHGVIIEDENGSLTGFSGSNSEGHSFPLTKIKSCYQLAGISSSAESKSISILLKERQQIGGWLDAAAFLPHYV
ncbi:hypothetical protein F5Y16DRAFT_402635 [Xylariaceae sp. FL0255]|nr:hypothetical protein F5Y16DRAFT_402635 [Xylariaceae sp. FL0255]